MTSGRARSSTLRRSDPRASEEFRGGSSPHPTQAKERFRCPDEDPPWVCQAIQQDRNGQAEAQQEQSSAHPDEEDDEAGASAAPTTWCRRTTRRTCVGSSPTSTLVRRRTALREGSKRRRLHPNRPRRPRHACRTGKTPGTIPSGRREARRRCRVKRGVPGSKRRKRVLKRARLFRRAQTAQRGD